MEMVVEIMVVVEVRETGELIQLQKQVNMALEAHVPVDPVALVCPPPFSQFPLRQPGVGREMRVS